MGEIVISIGLSVFPFIIQAIFVYRQVYSYGGNRSGHRSHISQFSVYNYGVLNISHLRFPQESYYKIFVRRKPTSKYYLRLISKHANKTPFQACHNIPITKSHLIFFLILHHTQFSCVHIVLLLLCMHLM